MSDSCSETSLRLGESIGGTALDQTTHWLMIESGGSWPRKPIDAPALQGPVRIHVEAALSAQMGSRLQLIRRPSGSDGTVTVLLGVATAMDQRVHRLVLPNLDALLDVDLVGIWTGAVPAEEVTEPLALVCTHGMRDTCCAQQGVPVFLALEQRWVGRVWQTTHLGGHRFAATLVILPRALHYGRLRADEVDALVEGFDANAIHDLDRYRGCTMQPRTVQVAEAWIRRERKILDLEGVRWIDSQDNVHRFDVGGRTVSVGVQSQPSAEGRPFSCADSHHRHPPVHQCAEVSA